MRAFDALTQRYWAIQPDVLNMMASIALRQNDKDAWNQINMQEPEAVQGKFAPRMTGTARVTVRDSVAILPLTGPIFPKANMMTNMSGATSLDIFSHDFQMAVDDEGINAIIIDIDSPGGVAFGPGEMADIITKARDIKPIIAYVSGVAASAAYWIASAASEIVAHRSSELGSIGVVAGMQVQENPDTDGYRVIEIVSSNAQNKRPDPRTEEGAAEIRSSLDGIEAEFISTIADNRGISVDHVKSKFGQGGVMIASKAVKAGMADRLGSFDEVLSSLTSKNQMKGNIMNKEENKGAKSDAPVVTADNIRQNHPDVAEQLCSEARSSGYAEGEKAGLAKGAEIERERIAAIDKLARPGCETLISEAKADGKSTQADVALKILDNDKNIGANYLNTMQEEADKTPDIAPSVDTSGQNPIVPENASIEDRAKADWDNNPECRKGFPNFDAYLGARKAEDSGFGRVKSGS